MFHREPFSQGRATPSVSGGNCQTNKSGAHNRGRFFIPWGDRDLLGGGGLTNGFPNAGDRSLIGASRWLTLTGLEGG